MGENLQRPWCWCVCVVGGALGLTVAQEDLMLNVAVVRRSWYAAGRNGPVRVAGCPHGLLERLTCTGSRFLESDSEEEQEGKYLPVQTVLMSELGGPEKSSGLGETAPHT